MFYSFYFFLSILLCDVDNALVSDSSAYIWISNCIQMFEFIWYIAFQELEWLAVDDVNFDDAEADILGWWYDPWNPCWIPVLWDVLLFKHTIFFVLLVLSWKKNIWKRKEISLLLLLSFLNSKLSFFIGKGVGGEEGGYLCWAWRNARGLSWTNMTKSVMVGCRWVKKAILAWSNYWAAPLLIYFLLFVTLLFQNVGAGESRLNFPYHYFISYLSRIFQFLEIFDLGLF